MARIRSIKPEFPQSESIGRLSRDARLLFIQLWTIADDSGRARASSRMLASLLYPYDDDAPKLMAAWLGDLEKGGLIRQYEVEGNAYLEIVKWLKHQKIDRPSPSRFPEYREDSTKPRESSRSLDADLGPRTLDMDLGPRTEEVARKRACRIPKNWMPSREGGQFAISHGLSQSEANTELEKFTNYWTAKGGQGATKLDWDATWRNWILTATERKGNQNGRSRQKGESLAELGTRLADEIRTRELEEGIGRPPDAL